MRRLLLTAVLPLLACASSAGTDPQPAGLPPAPPPPPPATGQLNVGNYATGLSAPTDIAFLPDGRMLITEKGGTLKLRATGGAVTVAGSFPVDTASEKGLLGVAVDPDFAANRRLFFYYSRSSGAGTDPGTDLDRHRVVSILLKSDGTLDAPTETILVRGLRGPANHDGGALAIGPDGKLYVGVGDTGCNSGLPPEPPVAPSNYFPTCLTEGNGKILRVNLDGTIPADNPLAAVSLATACGTTCGASPFGLPPLPQAAPRRDVWAWGFRNPWRFAFDPVTGSLWAGDVGEVSYEEITIVQKGRHHGWPWREGGKGWGVGKCRETVPDTGDCVEPVYFCSHASGSSGGIDGGCDSITGGAFLHGAPWPAAWQGQYLFADNATGALFTLRLDAARAGVVAGSRRQVGSLSTPVSIRMGPDNAAYVVALGSGSVVRAGPP